MLTTLEWDRRTVLNSSEELFIKYQDFTKSRNIIIATGKIKGGCLLKR